MRQRPKCLASLGRQLRQVHGDVSCDLVVKRAQGGHRFYRIAVQDLVHHLGAVAGHRAQRRTLARAVGAIERRY